MILRVGGVATDVNAVWKLAWKGFRLDAIPVDEFVLLEDVSVVNLRINLTVKMRFG